MCIRDRHTVGQSGKSKVQQIIITKSRSDHRDVLNCDDIQGVTDRTSDILDAAVTSLVPIPDGSTVGIIERSVVVNSSQSLAGTVQSGSVGGHYLEGRSGQTLCTGSTVQEMCIRDSPITVILQSSLRKV